MTTLAILRKFGPYLLIVALAFVVLFQRNTITGKAAKLDAAEQRISELDRVKPRQRRDTRERRQPATRQ